MKMPLLLTALLLAPLAGLHAAESLPNARTKSLAASSMMVSPVQGGRTEQRQPHLCLLSNGRVVATWTRRYEPHRRGTCVYSAFSDDGGRNWSQPVLVTEGVGKNEIVYCDGKRIWNFHTLSGSEGKGTLAIRASDDGGVTWQPQQATQPVPGRFPVTDGRVVQVQGQYLMPGHFVIDSAPSKKRLLYQGVIYVSDDLLNWRECATVGEKRLEHTMGEPQLVPLGGSELLLVGRTRIGSPVAGSVTISRSHDAGRNWSPPVSMPDVPNADTKPCYLLLPNGRHVAVYNKPKPGHSDLPLRSEMVESARQALVKAARSALFLRSRRGTDGPWGTELLVSDESGWAYAADGVVVGDYLLLVWESDDKKAIRSSRIPLDAIP